MAILCLINFFSLQSIISLLFSLKIWNLFWVSLILSLSGSTCCLFSLAFQGIYFCICFWVSKIKLLNSVQLAFTVSFINWSFDFHWYVVRIILFICIPSFLLFPMPYLLNKKLSLLNLHPPHPLNFSIRFSGFGGCRKGRRAGERWREEGERRREIP